MNNIRIETEKEQLKAQIKKLLQACFSAGLDSDDSSKVIRNYFDNVSDDEFLEAYCAIADDVICNGGF